MFSVPQTGPGGPLWTLPLPWGSGEKPLPTVICCTPLCYAHPSFPHLTWLGSSTPEGPDLQPVPVPKPWRDTWGHRAGGEGGEEKQAQSREGQVG